jgi:hypothetical protein
MMIKNTKGKIFDFCIYTSGAIGIFLPGAFVGALAGIGTGTEWIGGIVAGALLIFQLYFLPKINEL